MKQKPQPSEISEELQRCLDFLNVTRSIHDKFPLNRFLWCNSWENADFPSAFPTYVFFKFRKPVINSSITSDNKSYVVAFGRIYGLFSSGMLFGYLFEFSKVRLKISENHMMVYMPTYDIKDLTKIEQLYHNPVFTIFKGSESLIVTLNSHHYIKFKNKKVKDKSQED